MPYIKPIRRDSLGEDFGPANTPGELNYLLTLVCKEYMDRHGLEYSTINDIIGALEGAKLEFYRRIAAPYEDGKIKENGDIY